MLSSKELVPGPCPSCGDVNAYWDGGALFVCTACSHEWSTLAGSVVGPSAPVLDADQKVIDSNGVLLTRGDSVVLIKALGKDLKKGLKISKIRLGDFGDGHDVEATIAGLGTYALKAQFLKKV